jgi:hypothetical protein
MATVIDSYTSGIDSAVTVYGTQFRAQVFTASQSYTINSVILKLYRLGDEIQTLTVRLYGVDTSTPVKPDMTNLLATGTMDADTLTTDSGGLEYTISFVTPVALTSGTQYAIVCDCRDATVGAHYAYWKMDTAGATYTGGTAGNSGDSGSNWTMVSAQDNYFKTTSSSGGSASAPVDKRFSKQLVTACNNEIWYESASGTMSKLTAAADDIDTTAPLQMFELYEKVFVVDGTKLKVADFGNTKLACSALTDPPAHGDILTQATSGAQMVVDFVTTAKTAIYGKTITGTFNTANNVSSSDTKATMNPATFVPSAVTAPTTPHWYDWTVYPDTKLSGTTSSYGTMPTQATLGCPWRGRPCLSGDEDYPHQWYQARQENPWDWNYVSADVQSPVSGGGDASIPGQVGDIVVAQIPFDRDHLIYGGANSLWVLSGDAAEGGILNCFYDEGGILGARAWCKDNKNNLFIMSTAGLLRIPQGFGPPENLTDLSYPDFIKDLAYNSSTHRIVMGYDRKRNGVKIQKTTLATGANTGWWWDLRAEALYPESYGSTEHGIFSMFHYEAVDPDYNVLLLGCNNGYLYYENDDATDDTKADDTAQAIDSYVTFGPIKLGEENREGKVNSLVGVLAGGGSSGSEADSNDVAFKIWTKLSADEISEAFSANSGQKVSGTIKAPGRWRGNQFRRSIRGMFAGIRIGNSTAGEVWGLERLLLGIKRAGRIK